MGEILIPAQFDEEPVIKGKISLDITPRAIEVIINTNPPLGTEEFNDYLLLRTAEHGLEFEKNKHDGFLSAEDSESLEAVKHGIMVFETRKSSFQEDLTVYLNSAINKHR